MSAKLRAAAVLVGVGIALWLAPAVSAHALLSSSSPSAGQTLAGSPSQIEITFTETIDFAHSLIQVLDTSGKIWASGHPDPVAGQPATVARLPLPQPLPKGVYTVNWKTISTVDGHLAANSFSFGVEVAPGSVTSTASVTAITQPGPSELAIVSRWIYLSALLALLGLAFLEMVVLSVGEIPAEVSRRVSTALRSAWILALLGALGMLQSQRAGAGLSPSATLGSSIGHAFLIRAVPLGLTGVGLLALRAGRRRRRPVLAFVTAGTLASMLADVLKSHAAAAASWLWYRIGTQWLHFAAAGIWVGGLAGLLLVLGPLGAGRRLAPVRRFSFWAAIAIVAVGITGTLRALDEVGSWEGLFRTSFGQLIIVKIVLFGTLAALGALNRYRHVAATATTIRGLIRTGTAELVAMALVLGATGWLQNLAPARTQLASEASAAAAARPAVAPILVETTDFAHTYKLHLTISPGTAGFDTFDLTVDNYLTGAPVSAGSATIGFSALDEPTLGSSELALAAKGVGRFTATGANLSILGPWNLTITVGNGLNSVEVTVPVVTESPAQQIQVQRFTGSPTVYNVPAGGGNEIQIYLDPLNLGKAEFHATFLDATGQELQMAPLLAVNAQAVPGGAVTGKLFTYRNLDSIGHFVADAIVPKGTYQFNVVGTTVTGTALGATLTAPVN